MSVRGVSLLAVSLLSLSVLGGCNSSPGEFGPNPTAPGFSRPDIRGVYSGVDFWTLEAVRLADGVSLTWSCSGRVTVIRQSGADFLGTFALGPPDQQLCPNTSGDLTGGIVGANAQISFSTVVPGQDPNEFFGLPGCDLVAQDPLWGGLANGDRFVASRGLTVDCPAEGRLQITATADGSRTADF